ncbi:MAG: hypothetical protein QOD09_4916, partial [Bradyrhizobium sp.]|nr:hypothetical protein [Bradyrhizobium sp.]
EPAADHNDISLIGHRFAPCLQED